MLGCENTLKAMEKAILEGAKAVEVDVQLSNDGVPVIIHNGTEKETHANNLETTKIFVQLKLITLQMDLA